MRPRIRVIGLVICLPLILSGCTDGQNDTGDAQPTSRVQPSTSTPDAPLTLIADADPAAAAISTSRALYDSSEVVVLAGAGDATSMTLGASAAVALGVPLLVSTPTPAIDVASPVGVELERLSADFVLAIGTVAAHSVPSTAGTRTVSVPAAADAVAEAIGMELASADPVPVEGLAAAFADLDPGAPTALLPADAPVTEADATAIAGDGQLPETSRAADVSGTLVLATSTPESLPGIATARAAGVAVQIVGAEQLDPRSSAVVITALSAADPDAVIALGAGYATQQGLDWKLAAAATGVQLPAGVQLLFPLHTFVALYGFTEGPGLGVLGEQDADRSVQRAIDTAAPYRDLVPTTVVPMFEIIATVASGPAGDDGNYSAEATIASLQPWVDAAGAAGIYVVLDLQPGRTDFLTQARLYEPLLRLPFVGLALDPEWRLGPSEVHLHHIGTVSIEEVNSVVTWLADLTRANALPQKLLVLHQFALRMIENRELLDTSREELAVLIHVDGQGSQPDKQATWRSLHQSAPANLSWGWKNFVDEDLPMLTPGQTIAQVLPTPQLITYQ